MERGRDTDTQLRGTGLGTGFFLPGWLNDGVRLHRLLPILAASVLLVSGCGVAETQFHPGVAAQVGDQTVSVDDVDALTSSYCAAVEDQITAGGQSFPLAGFKSGIAAQLALVSAVDQLNEAYDVTPSSDYNTQVNQLKQQGAALEGKDLDAYLEVQSAQAYISDLLTQIGSIELEDEGEKDPTLDFQQARGQDALESWVAREGLTFDPRYSLEIVEGQPQPVDTDLTFAVGDIAKAGRAGGEPDPNYVASLPLSATCG